MNTQEQIDEIVVWDGLRDFGRFVLSHSVDGGLPDYTAMDLMRVPRLVPYIWVYDLRTEDNVRRLMMGFAGERHTEMHGRNVSGQSDAEIFTGYGFTDDVIEHYHKSIREQKVGYNKRHTKFASRDGVKYRHIESLFFPCSSDGATVNWGIGCLTWDVYLTGNEWVFAYF